jgi:hypothetical protein
VALRADHGVIAEAGVGDAVRALADVDLVVAGAGAGLAAPLPAFTVWLPASAQIVLYGLPITVTLLPATHATSLKPSLTFLLLPLMTRLIFFPKHFEGAAPAVPPSAGSMPNTTAQADRAKRPMRDFTMKRRFPLSTGSVLTAFRAVLPLVTPQPSVCCEPFEDGTGLPVVVAPITLD